MRRSPRYDEHDHSGIEKPEDPDHHPQGQKALPGLNLVGTSVDLADLLSEFADVVSQIFVSPVLHLLLLS
jgi:hypothetical protein